MSLPQDIFKKVRLLDLSTRKIVNSVLSGEYHSAFKGRGMIFSEFREYVPGDDVRTISWPLMARTGKLYVKQFDEERELVLILAIDTSASLQFGSGIHLKGEVITHLAALLGFSASKNKDSLGLLMFSDQIEHFVPPKKGPRQVHRILRDLYFHKPQSKETKITSALDYLQSVLKKRSLIFLFSDFMDKGFENALRVIGKKHDLVAVVIEDKVEKNLPSIGLIHICDAETNEVMTLDSSSPFLKRHYKKNSEKRREIRDRTLGRAQVDRLHINCNEDFVKPLVAFLKQRYRK